MIADLHGRPKRMSLELADDIEIPEADRTPILLIVVRNRGRRPVQIHQLAKRYWFSTTRTLFTTDQVGELPADIEGGHLQVFVVAGTKDPYMLGSIGSLSRTYAVDGAERIHPLRERWLQAIENVVFFGRARRCGSCGSDGNASRSSRRVSTNFLPDSEHLS